MSNAFGIEGHGEISKSLKTAAIVGGAAAGAAGLQAGVNEGVRRHYNNKGANVSVKNQYVHPYKSQYAQSAAATKVKAEKVQTRADASGSAIKAVRANRLRGISSNYNEASKMGALKARRAGRIVSGRKGLDAQHNNAPAVIGKSSTVSAFGVEH